MATAQTRALPDRRLTLAGIAIAVVAAALILASIATLALALTLPALTGRVVDQANFISQETRGTLETKLADLESKSGIQLVVATISSLEGEEIEPYANQLFRSWQLGEKTKNNGVLLLVAPNERKVRIEVGYGLEGTLTDALSKVIITNAITPRFKTGDFSGGIARGVEDIITVLTTDASEWQARPELRLDSDPAGNSGDWFITMLFIAFVTMFIVLPGFRWLVLNAVTNIMLNSGSSSGGNWSSGSSSGGSSWSSGSSSSGGFSGGGGSSGGGGASGSW
jgi:uncharacterized protein